ncbi:MAG: PilZ domain-containing protein [Lachnospira sp.]|uniref:PilZ domain-containing protein n=1 Tax=Lachnospira sp. TaxID=2049031 RepID=UPI00257DE375|nr:PilZ domain-containing protein [Lachnospira sp.]MCR5515979.1 PilZ domain-containing protein [Lachnospira sp.]
MNLSELITGNMVTLQVPLSDSYHEFGTRIVGKKDGVLILSCVKVAGKNIRMPLDKINIYCQLLNKLYIWRGVKVDTLPLGARVYYRIKDTNLESENYNRRGAYRLPVDEILQLGIYRNGEEQKESVLVKDISESGFAFITNREFKKGDRVRLSYTPEEETFDMHAYIIRSLYNAETGKYSYGCKMPEFDALLGGFIMKEQIRRRKMFA